MDNEEVHGAGWQDVRRLMSKATDISGCDGRGDDDGMHSRKPGGRQDLFLSILRRGRGCLAAGGGGSVTRRL